MNWVQKIIGLGGMKPANCINCHFLQKTYAGMASKPIPLGVSGEDRKKIQKNDFSWLHDTCSLGCHQGVWDEGYDFDPKKRHELLVKKDRAGFCFFLENHPGMFMPAAKILQERVASKMELATDRRLTLIGLWIAAFGLIANVAFEVYKHSQEKSVNQGIERPGAR